MMRLLPAALAILLWASPRPAGAAPMVPLASSRYAAVVGEEGEARLAGYLTGLIDKAAPRAAKVAGAERVMPVRVFLYRTGQGQRSDIVTPVGMATYPDQTIQIDASLVDVRQLPGIVSHELAHIMMMRAAAPNYAALPRWFSEGVAAYVEGRSRWQADDAVQRAEDGGIEAPLANLDEQFIRSYAVDPGQRHTVYAYAKSTSVVYFLVDSFGGKVIARLLAAMHRQGGFPVALQEVTGLTEGELEAQWRKSLPHGRPPWIALLDPNLMVWAAMAALLTAAVVRYWIVRRRREAEPEEETPEPGERRPLGW